MNELNVKWDEKGSEVKITGDVMTYCPLCGSPVTPGAATSVEHTCGNRANVPAKAPKRRKGAE